MLIDDETPWVRDYRGLWGLDTADRFGGERAPAGPRYERDGSIRPSWANPLGWAGLLKVPPAGRGPASCCGERVAEIEGELARARRRIASEPPAPSRRSGRSAVARAPTTTPRPTPRARRAEVRRARDGR